MVSPNNQITSEGNLIMDIITQVAHHRQRMLKFSKKHTIEETCARYKISRKTFYKWLNRYDGTIESLKDRSHRPKSHPSEHTAKEIKMIKRALKRFGKDLLQAYQFLCKKHYKRSYGGFKRMARKLWEGNTKKKKAKRKPKPYKRAEYPGQKVQIDVKYVPSRCVMDGRKYYQFTAKDECTRWTFREMYDEKSTYSALDFLEKLIQAAPFPIREAQTDNGTEFTNALLVVKATHKTLFEEALEKMDIIYHRIRIATPRHNGKVERQHRTDELRFYSKLKMYNLEDGRRQMAAYNKKSNGIIMTCLNMQSPNQVLAKYLGVM
jgi:transposase